ncbi:MAG: sulfurtransferase TusA family protein [Nitrososphaerales archaeon]
MKKENTPRTLDLTGQICPWPVIFTLKEIKKMTDGEILDVLVDHMPSTLNVPAAVSKEGHQVESTTRVDQGIYRITVRIGTS